MITDMCNCHHARGNHPTGGACELTGCGCEQYAAPSRISRDAYGLKLAEAAASRADCTRRQVGAVIVNNDGDIVATGYNGAPAGEPGCLSDGACPRGQMSYEDAPAGEGYEETKCIAIHAEVNACLRAGRDRAKGCTIYVTDEPCYHCSIVIRATGIVRVVTPSRLGLESSEADRAVAEAARRPAFIGLFSGAPDLSERAKDIVRGREPRRAWADSEGGIWDGRRDGDVYFRAPEGEAPTWGPWDEINAGEHGPLSEVLESRRPYTPWSEVKARRYASLGQPSCAQCGAMPWRPHREDCPEVLVDSEDQPTPRNAPRVWHADDPEPTDVAAVMDRMGFTWKQGEGGWSFAPGTSYPWYVVRCYAPLTEVLDAAPSPRVWRMGDPEPVDRPRVCDADGDPWLPGEEKWYLGDYDDPEPSTWEALLAWHSPLTEVLPSGEDTR